MANKLDSRQTEHRSNLPRLSDQLKPTLKQLLPNLDTEITPIFELRESNVQDLTLNIGASKIVNSDTGLTRTMSPIQNSFFDFSSGTVTLPVSSGGAIVISPGDNDVLILNSGKFVAILIQISPTGEISISQGTEATDATDAVSSLNFPSHSTTQLPIGYMVVENVGGTIQNITNENIIQFVGGGSGGSGGSTISKNQTSHGFSLLNGIYHNGTIWVKAKADLADTVAIYCVSEIVSANDFKATKFGSITATAHGKTVGQYYLQSEVISGEPTLDDPVSGFNNPLFYVESVDVVHMMVHRALDSQESSGDAYANKELSNLETTAVNLDLNPVDNTVNLGSAVIANRWNNIRSQQSFADNIFITDGTSTAKGIITYTTDSVEINATAAASKVKILATGDVVLDPTGDIDASDNRIKNLTDPTSSQHAATKKYVDEQTTNSNILINGDMRINQRGTVVLDAAAVAITTLPVGGYAMDRWKVGDTGVAAQIEYLSTSQPSALSGSRSIKLSTVAGGSGFMAVQQYVEDFALYAGKTVTASVLVKSDNANARIRMYDGIAAVEGTPHTGGGTWEELTLTFTVNASASQLFIQIITYNAGASAPHAPNDYIEFTGAKLELGSVATEFVADSYADSLRKCQRYLQVLTDGTLFRDTFGTAGFCRTNRTFVVPTVFVLEMRSPPTLEHLGIGEFTARTTTANEILTNLSIAFVTTRGCEIGGGISIGGLSIFTAGHSTYLTSKEQNNSSYLWLDAEIY